MGIGSWKGKLDRPNEVKWIKDNKRSTICTTNTPEQIVNIVI